MSLVILGWVNKSFVFDFNSYGNYTTHRCVAGNKHTDTQTPCGPLDGVDNVCSCSKPFTVDLLQGFKADPTVGPSTLRRYWARGARASSSALDSSNSTWPLTPPPPRSKPLPQVCRHNRSEDHQYQAPDLGRPGLLSSCPAPLWNALPIHIHQAPSLPLFKSSKHTFSNSLSPADPWPRYDPHSSSSLLSSLIVSYVLFVLSVLFILFRLSLVPCKASLRTLKSALEVWIIIIMNKLRLVWSNVPG